jgi:hypothetical protein
MKWNGRYYRPANGVPVYPKKEQSITELLKPLGEKMDRGNVWRPILNQPVNVFKEDATPIPSPSPTPTPTITPTGTLTPTPTNTITPTPTPSFVPSFDPDAAAYLAAVITAGGSTNATISGATDTLFTQLKSNGLYSKIKAFYPVLGGVAASHEINGNLNASFDLTFVGSQTHTASGFTTNNNTSYASTNYVPLTEHPSGTMNMGMFTNTTGLNAAVDAYMMGAYNSATRFLSWDYDEVSTGTRDFCGKYLSNTLTTKIDVGTVANSIGIVQIGGDGTTKTLTHNRSGVDSSASAAQDGGLLPNVAIYLGNLNLSGSPYRTAQARCAFAYMSDYLTLGETTTLSSIINTFQTTLGRNYY